MGVLSLKERLDLLRFDGTPVCPGQEDLII